MSFNELYTDNENEDTSPETNQSPEVIESPESEIQTTKLQACQEILAMYESCPHPEVVKPGKDGIKCRQIEQGLYAAMQVLKLTRKENETKQQVV